MTSSNPSVATVQDNNGTVTVTIVGAGTTEISVGFAGGTDYSAASDKFTLTVNKATPLSRSPQLRLPLPAAARLS